MAFRVRISRRAELDLLRIFEFINAIESEAAAKWFNRLEDLVSSLSRLGGFVAK